MPLPPSRRHCLRVVLMRPQSGGNVGSTARALKNMGLYRLVVVQPGPNCDMEQARWMAHGALDVLEGTTFPTTAEEALEGVSVVIGATARHRRFASWPVLDPVTAGALAAQAHPGGEVALVFGAEDTGLSNQELDACTHLVRIPTDPSHTSLNLSQAVLLLAYEVFRASSSSSLTPRVPRSASFADLEGAVNQGIELLERVEWFRGHGREQARVQLRQSLTRSTLRATDVGFLRGILRKAVWYLDHGPRLREREAWSKGWRPEKGETGEEGGG